jgi:hypothetical protein
MMGTCWCGQPAAYYQPTTRAVACNQHAALLAPFVVWVPVEVRRER